MNNVKNPKITKYTSQLSRILRHLSANDREDIVREIESHIYEKWETDSKGSFDEASLKGVLGKMGTPEAIAAQYCEQRGWARPPKSHAIRNTILAVLAILAITTVGIVYFSAKYIVNPVINMISGKGDLVKIDGNNVEILGGAISIHDDDKMSFHNDTALPADGIDTVSITNANGKIEIKGEDTDKASFDYFVRVFDGKDKDIGDITSGMKVTPKTENGTLYFDTNFDSAALGKIKRYSVDISATVPKKMNVSVTSQNGLIDIEDVGGSIAVSNKNGAINVDLDEDYSFTMKAETNVGMINCEFPTEKDGNIVTAKIGDGKNTLNLETKVGMINVDLED